ncbi:MAG: hypothetical protein C5B54_04805 [Acidobacteria bacterium]|nr:MAG: hypothetical protein C5B54_04805 [Acidobacteriota bacterium]
MGTIFFSNPLLSGFFDLASRWESSLFGDTALLNFPQDPIHQLLIHGFGAAAMILGAMLIYSAKDPTRFLAFIFIDGLGRLLFGNLMMVYVFRFHLIHVIALFGILELAFALLYIFFSWKLSF